MKADVIIIGSGVAGLNTACQLAALRPDIQIALVSQSFLENSNSIKAQGGIAISKGEEISLNRHIDDTFIAGGKYGNIDDIKDILNDAPKVLDQLNLYKLKFDEDITGTLHLTLEGGHSESRIIHVKDYTGKAIITAMIKYALSCKNIQLLEYTDAIELITERKDNLIYYKGVIFTNTRTLKTFKIFSTHLVLATGGVGSLYQQSTNAVGSNGNGIYLALKAGATLKDLEFIQFHPTGLYNENSDNSYLISEAVRGEGGILRNVNGERFMQHYDERLELAPRDIVARAICLEMMKCKVKYVYLDCKNMKSQSFQNRFPSIYKKCIEQGINPENENIPVVPMQHFQCGGVWTDTYGRTTIKNLFAVGECASSGLHGANRLASNSLLECMIISTRIAKDLALSSKNNLHDNIESVPFSFFNASGMDKVKLEKMKTEMQSLMTNEVGMICTNNGLQLALDKLSELLEKTKAYLNGNCFPWEAFILHRQLLVAQEIIRASIKRKKNVGTFYNLNLEKDLSLK